jgi:thiamine-monophosphate kinase
MTLKTIGEFGFIETISKGCIPRPEDIVRGIGDDAAVFRGKKHDVMLLTTDLMVERVHFDRRTSSGFSLGYKALAVNLSDIAAMGGTPLDAFVSIAVPDDCHLNFLETIYDGMKAIAQKFSVNILGGDTTRSKSDLVVNIALTGCAPESEILYRHTAREGDVVYAAGYLGDSRAGLYLMQNADEKDMAIFEDLVNAHLFPKPFVSEGRFLAEQQGVHAAIDVSDGLSSDIAHICKQSGKGVRIFAERIPISKQLASFCRRFGFDPVDMALTGGEDYTLLVTISSEVAESVENNYLKAFGSPIYPIGEVVNPEHMELVNPDGLVETLEHTGWDHFKNKTHLKKS